MSVDVLTPLSLQKITFPLMPCLVICYFKNGYGYVSIKTIFKIKEKIILHC